MDFSVIHSQRDTVARLVVEGELDVATVDPFMRAVDQSLDQNPSLLLVDARRVGLLASLGAEALLVAAARCHRASVGFRLDCSLEARRTLDLLDLWWLGVLDDGFSVEVELGGEIIDVDEWRASG
jgi:anti-anti-sigma factor